MGTKNKAPSGFVANAVDIALATLILMFLALVSAPGLLMRPTITARMLTPGCVIFVGRKKRTVRSISYGDGLIGSVVGSTARVLKIEFEDGTETECHPQTSFKVTRASYKRWPTGHRG